MNQKYFDAVEERDDEIAAANRNYQIAFAKYSRGEIKSLKQIDDERTTAIRAANKKFDEAVKK